MNKITIEIDDADVQPGDVHVTVADDTAPTVARSHDTIAAKVGELQRYDDYPEGDHAADYRRAKHSAWREALLWVLGSDTCVRPL